MIFLSSGFQRPPQAPFAWYMRAPEFPSGAAVTAAWWARGCCATAGTGGTGAAAHHGRTLQAEQIIPASKHNTLQMAILDDETRVKIGIKVFLVLWFSAPLSVQQAVSVDLWPGVLPWDRPGRPPLTLITTLAHPRPTKSSCPWAFHWHTFILHTKQILPSLLARIAQQQSSSKDLTYSGLVRM